LSISNAKNKELGIKIVNLETKMVDTDAEHSTVLCVKDQVIRNNSALLEKVKAEKEDL
jgi:hypothetical protein